MSDEVRLVAMRFIPNENFGGTLVPVEPAYTHTEAWENGITEGEAYDATNPALMADRSTTFDHAAAKLRATFHPKDKS